MDEDETSQPVGCDVYVAYCIAQADDKGDIDKVQVVGEVGTGKGQTPVHSSGKGPAMLIEVVEVETGILLTERGVQEKPRQDDGDHAQCQQGGGVGRRTSAHRGEDDSQCGVC